MRSGDEPRNARSPLRLRLVLAVLGTAVAGAGALLFLATDDLPLVWVFGALAVFSLADVAVVRYRMGQGAHYQPGPSVPPYRPAQDEPAPRPGPRDVPEGTRMRRYFVLMGTCLLLICLAWFWVRLWSTGLAVAMSVVAAVIPPVAAIVANFNVVLPEHPNDPDDPDRRASGDSSDPRG